MSVTTDSDHPDVPGDAVDRGVPIAATGGTATRRYRGQRGPQRAPRKQMISLRLDAHVVERFRATGPGWQGRINETLAAHLPRAKRHRKASSALTGD